MSVTRRHQNRLNLRSRPLPPLSDASRALVERMRGQVPQLTPPGAGQPSALLGTDGTAIGAQPTEPRVFGKL